ncbi:hypothetical protein MNBD_GAMMA09-2278 [hydrothermal vent metagenome]|uniref:Transcription factor zinc-finger domain-containing protein n=1 Tax=hydrothermal vent metagenome TaxID=652676 RepID=A0A3B0XTU5_9ZZZZ
MLCPACEGSYKKIKLDEHLLGKSCIVCEGVSFTLSDYLYYLSHSRPVEEEPVSGTDNVIMLADTKKAMVCHCGHVVSKFSISHETDRRIDYCSACQTVYLDKGEWEYLKSVQLRNKINSLFTDSCQRQIKLDGTRQVLTNNYKEKLGAINYDHMTKVRDWIYNSPDKDLILSFLNAKDPYSVLR